MEEILQYTLDGILVPKVKVVEFDQVGQVMKDLQRQAITGRVVVKIP
jgi:propanol-preferring alcohol dehydrogenase